MPILVLVLKRSWHIEALQKKAKGKVLTDIYKNFPFYNGLAHTWYDSLF